MYTEFADIYDTLMSDVEYEKWADFYEEIFVRNGKKPELVLDLGCGTGTLTKIMADRGYDMTGIDGSLSMLNIAKEKGGDILYLCQKNFFLLVCSAIFSNNSFCFSICSLI